MSSTVLLRTSVVLWVVWGLVHVLAGLIIITGDTASAIQAIADGVDPELLSSDYHDAVGAIINQHGWNLVWFGVATMGGAVFIWRGSLIAIWITAMIGGLADLGYFIYLDLGGHVNFVPGTLMTIVSSAAILSSITAYFLRKQSNS